MGPVLFWTYLSLTSLFEPHYLCFAFSYPYKAQRNNKKALNNVLMHRFMPDRFNHDHSPTQKHYASSVYAWVFSIVVSVLVFSAPFSAYSASDTASFEDQNPQISFSDFGLSVATRFGFTQYNHQQDADLDNSDEHLPLLGYRTHLVLVDFSRAIFSKSFEYTAFYWKGISSRGPPSSL